MHAKLKYVPSPLDPYDVLAPTCQDKSDAGSKFVSEYTPHLDQLSQKYGLKIDYNPCISELTPKYLNRPDVQKAIHVTGYTRTWPNHPPNWSYNEGVEGAKKDIALLFPKFFAKAPQWKIAVVSGTADSGTF